MVEPFAEFAYHKTTTEKMDDYTFCLIQIDFEPYLLRNKIDIRVFGLRI